jgi:hypothetical protein
MTKICKKAAQHFLCAVSKVFDRVKSVALWSANIRKLAKDHKGYGSAANTWHNFFWKNSWFWQNVRRERSVFHFIFNENGKSEAVFQHFWSARRQLFFKNLHSGYNWNIIESRVKHHKSAYLVFTLSFLYLFFSSKIIIIDSSMKYSTTWTIY